MKVLLVNPTRTGVDSYVSPPLHLVYIARAIEAKGHDAKIIDVHYDIIRNLKTEDSKSVLEQQKIKEILEMDFDLLGIGSIVSAFDFTKQLVNAVRARRPQIPIIIGGGMSIALKDLWEEKTDVEYLVESDGEMVIQQFIDAYPDKELYQHMIDKGIVSDTEEYLKVQTGVGNYKYNLCGINIHLLKLIRNTIMSKVDFYYHLSIKKYRKAFKGLLVGSAKIIFESLFPDKIKKAIKNIINRRRLGI